MSIETLIIAARCRRKTEVSFTASVNLLSRKVALDNSDHIYNIQIILFIFSPLIVDQSYAS